MDALINDLRSVYERMKSFHKSRCRIHKRSWYYNRRKTMRIKSIRTVCPKDITRSLLARWKGIVYVKYIRITY